MVKTFDSWRNAQMSRFAPFACTMRYHRIDADSASVIVQLLRSLLKARLSSGKNVVTLSLSDDVYDAFLLFLDEFRYAYIHPRSTSAKFDFVKQLKTACPSHVQNL